jgi:ABC-type transport system involved in cytochrome bd biosynthesis fused ATPase/permease subunit
MQTTIAMTVSPLMLHHADQVAFLQGGTVTDVGTHDELLARNAGYRHVVVRALDDPEPTDPDTHPDTDTERLRS